MNAYLVLIMALVLNLAAGPVHAAGPDATISIDLRAADPAHLSGSWGQGVATFGPKTYRFKVKGLNVLAPMGILELEVQGAVHNLKNIADLEGTYKKADAAQFKFIKKGELGLVVKNEKGVVMNLKGVAKPNVPRPGFVQKQLDLGLGKDGLTVMKVE